MTKRILNIAFAAAALILPSAYARADKAKNVLDLKTDITDSNIVYPESYEVNTQKLLESWYLKNYTATDDRYKRQGDVSVSDAVIRERLSKLNTVIEMPFNQIVRSYIDRYTQKSRGAVAAILGLGIYYMPIFEQALEEQGLPLELKYLPVIESALNPNAVSKHGATGLWQFMLATGKGLDLEISSLVDERRDPYKSSQKAAKFLKDLHDTYGDWSLAIAAYNCGPGTVNKALRRAGGDPGSHDFWSIYYYLPSETRGYVPMFIAANYVMNYYQYHNISPVLATKPLITDTLMIGNRVHFNQISKVLDIPVDELRVLNPQFRADVIPGHSDRMYTLVLPSQQIHAYIMSEDAILAYDADRYAQRTDASPGEMPGASLAQTIEEESAADDSPFEQAPEETAPPKKSNTGATRTVTHKVEPGESLASIAKKYEVSPEDIKGWNNLSRNSVRTGQMLRITTTPQLAEANGARDAAPAKNAARQSNTQQVKKETQQETASTTTARSRKSNSADKKADANANSKNDTNAAGKSGSRSSKTQNVAKSDTKKSSTKNSYGGKSSSKKNKKKAKPKQPVNHSVKSGENLSTIAKKYGTTVSELKKANNLKGDQLHPGDNLKLPSKGKSSGKSGTTSSKKKSSKSTGTSSKSKKKKKK